MHIYTNIQACNVCTYVCVWIFETHFFLRFLIGLLLLLSYIVAFLIDFIYIYCSMVKLSFWIVNNIQQYICVWVYMYILYEYGSMYAWIWNYIVCSSVVVLLLLCNQLLYPSAIRKCANEHNTYSSTHVHIVSIPKILKQTFCNSTPSPMQPILYAVYILVMQYIAM